ncbi:hypothetical protein B0T18DRAFT_327769 [Schizothecium vesticola]|uniref:Arylamine N-acetyltransferase n=1 Tax=Schizothecium vesticola TaxID=314040 RepID=A0AA40ENR4_9PEZI|nr:hypothetical protein B0T18DRAFT_327769 [Schizothecium vesticola]
MSVYTDEQLTCYFKRIEFKPTIADDVRKQVKTSPLATLARLQRAHMCHVPFENISLHYSTHRILSLEPEDLFDKIVVNSRGGYCMEVNTFLAIVLRSLGYTLISAGGRVSAGFPYKGWSHMVNLVTISGTRHLVDVGFGSHGATRPVPLQHGIEFPILDTFRGKLEYRALDMHTDRDQRLWVFSSREEESDPWRENYAFAELEFFAADFAVMNLHTSTAPQSFFVQTVVAEKTMEMGGEADEMPVGVIILFRDYVKIREAGKWTVVARLETEAQRIGALCKFFKITMSLREERAIRGLASELKKKV